jgi:hypothetical protein
MWWERWDWSGQLVQVEVVDDLVAMADRFP